MKRFQFRLGQVLRVRRLQEDQARANLLAANKAARQAEEMVEYRLAEYATRSIPSGPQSYDAFERALFLLDSAAAGVTLARAAHRDALDVVEERRDEWLGARRRVAALERLEDRRRIEHEIEARRDEDRFVDDLVVARHHRGVSR